MAPHSKNGLAGPVYTYLERDTAASVYNFDCGFTLERGRKLIRKDTWTPEMRGSLQTRRHVVVQWMAQ
uniref:Uncharacterized protein n=1 Tax=Lynx canadensis TaxID=61383 RepID=A0A667HYD1_LYNCA